MLAPLRHILNSERVILASSSPRRREILQNIDLKFEVVSSNFDERKEDKKLLNNDSNVPGDYVEFLSKGKSSEVWNRMKNDAIPPSLVIGADTVVVLDNKIIGKPTSKENAKEILRSLSGRSHFVFTGISFITATKSYSFHEKTQVEMAVLTDEVIDAYVETGEPMDKAGGYGIQGLGGTLVKRVEGDYYNVVGFPLHTFCKYMVEKIYNTT